MVLPQKVGSIRHFKVLPLVKGIVTILLGLMDRLILSHQCCTTTRAVCHTSETDEGISN